MQIVLMQYESFLQQRSLKQAFIVLWPVCLPECVCYDASLFHSNAFRLHTFQTCVIWLTMHLSRYELVCEMSATLE